MRDWLRKLGPLLGLILVFVLFAVLRPRTFLNVDNLQIMMLQTAVVAAALDKQVSMRASTARRSELELSADYGVEPAAVKSMATRLQRRLGLDRLQPW